ncbi:MAG: hypothetical protein PHU56_00570 [Candidatus Pacebacteria bacterium]|nr:hypothetical protein [Candidatus Paceibacterota bacterium]
MRVEPFTVGDYVHVYNRGNRKQDIVHDEKDKWRFMQALRFFNDVHSSQNILRDILKLSVSGIDRQISVPDSVFQTGWPNNWPEREPLVQIICYFLGQNQYHLLLKEIKENGISKFMQKLGIGYTNYSNTRHKEVGRIFQGPYKSKTVSEQFYLEYLTVYIQVKNVFELFPGGFDAAIRNLDEAFAFAERYPFSSYPDFAGLRHSLIIDRTNEELGENILNSQHYKKFAREVMEAREYEALLEGLKIDE